MCGSSAVDGSDAGLPDVPIKLIEAGKANYVPFIVGTVKDEGSMFIPMMPFVIKGAKWPLDDKSLELAISHFFGPSTVQSVLAQYPESEYKSQDDRGAALLRDDFFT